MPHNTITTSRKFHRFTSIEYTSHTCTIVSLYDRSLWSFIKRTSTWVPARLERAKRITHWSGPVKPVRKFREINCGTAWNEKPRRYLLKPFRKKVKKKKRGRKKWSHVVRDEPISRWRNNDEWLFQHAPINDRFCTDAVTSASRQYHFYSGCTRFYATPRVQRNCASK